MNKKARILLLILSILVVSVWIGLVYVNNNYYPIWNGNNIRVWTGKSYNPDKVKIEFGVSATSINRKNDQELFEHRDAYKVVYENGEEQAAIINDYGENDFLLTYDNKYYLTFRHFKLNWKAQHNYSFGIYWDKRELYASVKIAGDYAMQFKHRMIPIDSASFYYCNVLCKDAGVIYDGVELK